MNYTIGRQGRKWTVVNEDGDVVSVHRTKLEAREEGLFDLILDEELDLEGDLAEAEGRDSDGDAAYEKAMNRYGNL